MGIPVSLTGLVIDRKSPLYDEARLEYHAGLPPTHPLYIVFCQNVHDIQNAIRWSRRHGVPIRVRSGRHSYEGYSTVNNGVVMDVSRLNQVRWDPGSGLSC
jgi:FAD/FMN-containing dehydrogenase